MQVLETGSKPCTLCLEGRDLNQLHQPSMHNHCCGLVCSSSLVENDLAFSFRINLKMIISQTGRPFIKILNFNALE